MGISQNIKPDLHGAFYNGYVELVVDDPISEMGRQQTILKEWLLKNKSKLSYRYNEDKWTIRQVVMHMIDAELIFGYRLLRIGRGDQIPLEGFDQNDYIDSNDFKHLQMADLVQILDQTRQQTLAIISTLDERSFSKRGIASGYDVSVGSLIYIIAGHAIHHTNILLDRYV